MEHGAADAPVDPNRGPGGGPVPNEAEDLRLLVDGAADFAMIFMDTDRRIVRWNPGAERLFGWSAAEAVGRPCDIVFTPEDRAAGSPQDEMDAALRGGRAEDERWHVRKDGTRFWGSGVMVPLFDPATGGLRGFGKVLRDVTERRRAENALRASRDELRATVEALRGSEERTRALVGNLPGGAAFVVGPDMRYRLAGGEALAPAGMTPADLMGKTLAEAVGPDLAADYEPLFRGALERGEPFALEHDAHGRSFVSRGTPLRDGSGRVEAVLAVSYDITERRQAEAALAAANDALARANETLEAGVQERTEELAGAMEELAEAAAERQALVGRLVAAQEEERRRISRELHDEMGQLLTGFSLGLKSLEGVIGDFCPAGTGAAQTFERLRRLAEQMGREVHRVAVELRPTSLDDLGLLPALEAYVGEWQERTGVPGEFVAAGLDGERLPPLIETTVYRVVQEALNNAAKYAVVPGPDEAAGATRVCVTLQRIDASVLATVEDDGPGFDAEEASKKGRLGLTGMRERAQLAGGSVQVESAPGEGTTVFLRLPLSPPVAAAAATRRRIDADSLRLQLEEAHETVRRAAQLADDVNRFLEEHRHPPSPKGPDD